LATTLDQLPPLASLIEIARDFHGRGWMAGTAGNLSVRSDPDHFWITASGQPKGRLEESDFLEASICSGEVLQPFSAGAKPSADTSIHRVLYDLFPNAAACLHVHTVDACIAAEHALADAESLPLPPLEMLKGLGIWEQDPKVTLPLFENLLNVADISDNIRTRFENRPPRIPALMIRGHGVTVWGDSLQQAYDRIECLEFIMTYLARRASCSR
jgi:methylthioribulose-1-phosphate dehydratase